MQDNMAEAVGNQVVGYTREALAEDDPRWAKLFEGLQSSGAEMTPERLLTESFSAGGAPSVDRQEFPYLFAGRLLANSAYHRLYADSEVALVRERVHSLDDALGKMRTPDTSGRVEEARRLIVEDLYPEVFAEQK